MLLFKNKDEKSLYARISGSETDSNECLLGSERPLPPSGLTRRSKIITAFNILLFIINFTFAGIIYDFHYGRQVEFGDLDNSIASNAIKFETQTFDYIYNARWRSPYVGTPRPELDAAWRELKKYGDITIPESVMADLGRLDEGVKLPDGTGYLGTLNVYHELHCVQQMYRWLHKDYYFPNMTEEEYDDEVGHIEHCLEALRAGVQCNADLSIVTLKWGHKQPLPLANWDSPHVCKNWDSVQEWSKDHYVARLREPGWLIHPKLGIPAFQNISRIGVVHDS